MVSTLQPELARAVALAALDEPTPAAIVALLEDAGEHDITLGAADVGALVAARDELRALFAEIDRDAAAERLNAILRATAGCPRLVRHEGWDWHLHVDHSDDAPWGEWLLASAALALAELLIRAATVPWGICGAPGCGRPFLHDGRGAPRRWCSTRCATRERVRRHRAAHPSASRGTR